MSYRLDKPYTEKQKIDFIVEYNHNKDLRIEETDIALYALEAWELLEDNEVIDNTEGWEAEQAQKERERLDKLSMTRGDVFEALILAKGLGKAQIRSMIEQAELDELTKALYLNRFDEALDFYRGYPLFDLLGEILGIASEQLDKFFETKDYHELLPVEDLYVEDEKKSNTNEIVLPDEQVEVQDEDTTHTTESDIQDELDTTTSKSDETDTDMLE